MNGPFWLFYKGKIKIYLVFYPKSDDRKINGPILIDGPFLINGPLAGLVEK
jgi:hypothetical protein